MLEIRNQNLNTPAYCHRCGGTAQLKPGPALFIAGTWGAICQACAEKEAPALLFQMEMARYEFEARQGHPPHPGGQKWYSATGR